MDDNIQFERIFSYIKKKICKHKQPSFLPKAVILGGQPGAGKSALFSVLSEKDENFVFVNGDSFKSFHPEFDHWGYSLEVQMFSNKVVECLIEELSKEKYNLVIEGTMRNVDVPLGTARLLCERGYEVEAYIIATSKIDSWSSTIIRAESMGNKGLVPRYVSKETHDEAAERLPKNIKAICESGIFSDIVIMNREREELYRFSFGDKEDPEQILFSIINGVPVIDEDEIEI